MSHSADPSRDHIGPHGAGRAGRTLLAAASAVVLGAGLAACGSGGPAATGHLGQHGTTTSVGLSQSTTVHGQVDLGLGQLVVPPAWTVQAQDPCPMTDPKGSILLVGVQPSQSTGCPPLTGARPGTTVLWDFTSSAVAHGKPVVIVNGFDLYAAAQGRARGYLVPALGIELLWTGPQPRSVVSTLGWSPLHYVLTGAKVTTPTSWTRQYVDGVSVASPPSWPVDRPLRLECSGPFDRGPVVGLGVKVIAVPCAYAPPPTTPSDGVLVTTTDQLGDCPIRGTLDVAGLEATACSDPSVQPSELQVKLVFGTGPTAATVYVVVGLGGDGTVAREILASVAGVVPAASGGSA